MREFLISPFEENHISAVLPFTDRWIGENYFSESDLIRLINESRAPVPDLGNREISASCLAWQGQKLIGVRISLAPGRWEKGTIPFLNSQWPIKGIEVGYFKTLFVHGDFRGLGIGQRLSQASMVILRQQGAKGIVSHSWLESPGNSSQNYLLKNGFVEIGRHPLFWNRLDYKCVRCQPEACQCTAVEMFKILD